MKFVEIFKYEAAEDPLQELEASRKKSFGDSFEGAPGSFSFSLDKILTLLRFVELHF